MLPKLRSGSPLLSAFASAPATGLLGPSPRALLKPEARPARSRTRGSGYAAPFGLSSGGHVPRPSPWAFASSGRRDSGHGRLPKPAPCFVPPKMQLALGGKHLGKDVWGRGQESTGHAPKVSDPAPFLLQKPGPQLVMPASSIQHRSQDRLHSPGPTHASVLLRMLHPSPQQADGRPPTTLTTSPATAPDRPRSPTGCSPGLFRRPSPQTCFQAELFLALQGVCLYNWFLSTTVLEQICFDLEDGLLFLSLTGTPPLLMLLSVEIRGADPFSPLSSAS